MLIINKFMYAVRGLYSAFKMEKSFILHFAIEIPCIILGFILKINSTEWLILLLTISSLLTAELFNTSIEFLAKSNNRKYNELVEILLNISSGAVLVSIIFGVVIGIIIFSPYF
ncbi:MAG: diacylglycerol kinase [Spirochaetales bacterium]|nr:diacylglycerol kinase [Spirochaetales bacterium]